MRMYGVRDSMGDQEKGKDSPVGKVPDGPVDIHVVEVVGTQEMGNICRGMFKPFRGNSCQHLLGSSLWLRKESHASYTGKKVQAKTEQNAELAELPDFSGECLNDVDAAASAAVQASRT